MKYLSILILTLTMSGCSLFCPKPEIVDHYIDRNVYIIPDVPAESLKEESLPEKRIWNSQSLQGEDVGLYIMELITALENANSKIKSVREFLDRLKEKE